MPDRICVIDMPGLSRDLLTAIPADCALGRWLSGKAICDLLPTFPALTCPMQATLTTGVGPSRHGMIANGVATFRSTGDQALVDAGNFAEYRRQISFWEQSNQFLQSPRFWQDAAGKNRYKTALLFFQNSMPGFAGTPRPAADIVLTPKPEHGPDGKITSLCWSEPGDLVGKLFKQFGPFPLMNYWGPMAGIASSQWIAKASAWVWREMSPQLQWVYVPHLDYDLQRFGPSSPQAQQAVRDVAAAVEPLLHAVADDGGKLVLLSEYAMHDVDTCISPNRILAEAGLLQTRPSPDGNLIDYERSDAIAMVDHQIAHIYSKDPHAVARARKAFSNQPGFSIVESRDVGADHQRSGNFILLANPTAWFDYRWWSDPVDAPVFAKLVDIHRKPGYDPLELFWDRATNGVSQDTHLIRGSHGRADTGRAILAADKNLPNSVSAMGVAQLINDMLA